MTRKQIAILAGLGLSVLFIFCVLGYFVLGYLDTSTPEPVAMPKPTAAPTPTPLPPSLEEIVAQTLGDKYIFEQSYLGSTEGPNVLVIETRVSDKDQISFKDHIPFFVQTLHAVPDVSGIKLATFSIDTGIPYSIFVRASDIRLYERKEIDEFQFLMRWYIQ